MRRPAALFLLSFAVLLAQQPGNAQPADALKFFKNFFVTGDYIVAGVGLEGQGVAGLATGNIDLGQPGEPGALPAADQNAEVLAAFLYWQVVSSDGPDAGALTATFNGRLLSSPDLSLQGITTPAGPIAVVGDPGGTSPCWSSGGGTGQSGGSKRTYIYRADVLRFLDVVDGRHRITGTYQVQIPDQGNANSTPRALGASLVAIYRRPNPSPAQPLNAIVIYDGSYTMDNATQAMSQSIKGFYDPTGSAGKITHIVGSGQLNKTDVLHAPGINETNAFQSSDGAAWDTVTRTTAGLNGATSFTTSVDTGGSSSFDCLTWGAVIYRTEVNDTDADGLLNRWELATTASPLFDPNGERLPPLGSMSADPQHKDLFVEIGYMETAGITTYGGVPKPVHTHRPTYAALEKVGLAFAANGISVHFDVGNNYQGEDYIIDLADGARGGESLNETVTQCTPGDPNDTPWTLDQPWKCHYENYPGTVGWKTGFRFIRDEPPSGVTYEACEAAETDGNPLTTCARRFDSNRRDMFHYVWFAHALGLPRASCIDSDTGFPDELCQTTDPLFHVPVTNTGVGDFPGGDAMVTLGAFDNPLGQPVGTDHMQAATLMHELGHNFHLRHGAVKLTDGSIVREPNCKPNYLSVMNYLFQLRGLLGDDGLPQVDFSGQTLAGLEEASLIDSMLAGAPYRTGWYAPASQVPFSSAATKHCDGSPLLGNEPQMARVDSATVAATASNLIDWDLGTQQGAPYTQDLNFDGDASTSLSGFNDWENLRLNQVASRRNIGGWYWVEDSTFMSGYAAYIGPLSLNVGNGDLGNGDLGNGDLGNGDLGNGDLGNGDLGNGDLGNGDLGNGDLGNGDLGNGDLGNGLGNGDLGNGDLGNGDLGDGKTFELDIATVAANGFAPPVGLKATVNSNDVTLEWMRTTLASETRYEIYRYPTGGSVPTTPIATVNAVAGQTLYSFTNRVPPGTYTYAVVAVFPGGRAPAFVNVNRSRSR